MRKHIQTSDGIDRLDIIILEELQKNPSISNVDLSKLIGLSPPPSLRRVNVLREKGFIQIDFNGFGPINGYCWSTSVFMKTPCLLQRNFAGPSPIGGLNN